jgi:hypothetical protein
MLAAAANNGCQHEQRPQKQPLFDWNSSHRDKGNEAVTAPLGEWPTLAPDLAIGRRFLAPFGSQTAKKERMDKEFRHLRA